MYLRGFHGSCCLFTPGAYFLDTCLERRHGWERCQSVSNAAIYREESAECFQIGEEFVERIILLIDRKEIAEMLVGLRHFTVQLFQSRDIIVGTSDEILGETRKSDFHQRSSIKEVCTSMASVNRSPSILSSALLARSNSSRELFNSRPISFGCFCSSRMLTRRVVTLVHLIVDKHSSSYFLTRHPRESRTPRRRRVNHDAPLRWLER